MSKMEKFIDKNQTIYIYIIVYEFPRKCLTDVFHQVLSTSCVLLFCAGWMWPEWQEFSCIDERTQKYSTNYICRRLRLDKLVRKVVISLPSFPPCRVSGVLIKTLLVFWNATRRSLHCVHGRHRNRSEIGN